MYEAFARWMKSKRLCKEAPCLEGLRGTANRGHRFPLDAKEMCGGSAGRLPRKSGLARGPPSGLRRGLEALQDLREPLAVLGLHHAGPEAGHLILIPGLDRPRPFYQGTREAGDRQV